MLDLSIDVILFWVFFLVGIGYGAMEHFQLWNTPMSKYRSESLGSKFGQVSPRLAFVGLYAMAPVGLLLGFLVFGKLARLGSFMYLAHFAKRMLECAFVHVYSAPMDLFTVLYLGSCYISIGLVFAWDLALPGAASDLMQMLGVCLWVCGEATNGVHHWILRNLRKNPLNVSLVHEQSYVLPTGGLFDRVLFPHYLGEMIAWTGVALAIDRGAVYGVNLFMAIMQLGRASAGRQWYVKKFGSAAVEKRKVLLPGVL